MSLLMQKHLRVITILLHLNKIVKTPKVTKANVKKER